MKCWGQEGFLGYEGLGVVRVVSVERGEIRGFASMTSQITSIFKHRSLKVLGYPCALVRIMASTVKRRKVNLIA